MQMRDTALFSPLPQVCAYAFLDIIAKVVVSFMVMSAHELLGQSGGQSREYV